VRSVDRAMLFVRRGRVLPHHERMRRRVLWTAPQRSSARTVKDNGIANLRHGAGGGRCFFQRATGASFFLWRG